MLTFLWCLLLFIMVWWLAYHHAVLSVWSIAFFILLMFYTQFDAFSTPTLSVFWLIYLAIFLPLNLIPLRRLLVSKYVMRFFQKVMPRMSRTEKEALQAGTVSWEGELFSGKPHWKTLLKMPKAELSLKEKAFINGPVETLCNMIDDWELTHVLTDLPEKMWTFIKKQGFFGMLIPTEYGGLGFSATAQASAFIKVYGRSIGVATTISVPNSLGPAELLLKYGTEQQKNYYLPRLAKGEEIPCFALTGPNAGSDAASIPDVGIICHGDFENKKVLGIKLNWDKRYITLAPRATLLGLAFRLFDPDGLLGDVDDIGITCALIPTTIKGVAIGRRHFPLNTSFSNGPTQGKDVFIPLDYIIGGAENAGQGWRMLMECLSAGRAVSLPSSAVGGMQAGAFVTGAYARIRRQFNIPIGQFEGIEEPLARIAGYTYISNAAIQFTTAAIDHGAEPAVASAILKYHTTEFARLAVNDCMDIHGGKGICLGPNNYLGRHYQGMPIGITVEGANILTRCLIIFGQGAIRCHPYVIEELESCEQNDLKRFDKALFSHIGHIIANSFRAFFIALSGARIIKTPPGRMRRYFQILTRYSVAFAFVSEVAMLVLGANLKRREKLSARLGDALSMMYLASSVIKKYHDDGYPSEDLPVVRWSCRYCLYQIQEALFGVIKNFPNRLVALIMQGIIFPFGKHLSYPNDELGHDVAELMLTDNLCRKRLTALVHQSTESHNPIGQVEQAFQAVLKTAKLNAKVKQAIANGKIKRQLTWEATLAAALSAKVLTAKQVQACSEAEALVQASIAVDDFDDAELRRK